MQTQKVSDLLIQIGDVAKQLNIPASTIRYYEKIGLIKNQSRVSGRRCFDQNTLSTLQFIKLAQSVGFTITETKGLLEHFNNESQKQQQERGKRTFDDERPSSRSSVSRGSRRIRRNGGGYR